MICAQEVETQALTRQKGLATTRSTFTAGGPVLLLTPLFMISGLHGLISLVIVEAEFAVYLLTTSSVQQPRDLTNCSMSHLSRFVD